MGRQIKHDDATRELLLDAAERLLAEQGRDGVSVRAVADATGVSTRAIYTVFGSMQGLLGALAARGYRRLAELVDGLPVTDDALADLSAVGPAGMRRFALERPHLFRITFGQVAIDIYTQPEARAALTAAYDTLAHRIQRALDTGLMQPLPVAEIAFMFHSFTTGLALNELSREPPPVGQNFWAFTRELDFGELWETATTAFVNGLRIAG